MGSVVYLGFVTHLCPTCMVVSFIAGNPNHCFLEVPGFGVFESTRKNGNSGFSFSKEFSCKYCRNIFKIPIYVDNFDVNYLFDLVGKYKLNWYYIPLYSLPINWKAKRFAHCSEIIVDILRYYGKDIYNDECSRRISPQSLAIWANKNKCGEIISVKK